MKYYVFFLLVLLSRYCSATIFYIDPSTGNITNDGSISSPWSTLADVVDANLIETQEYSGLPYDPATSIIVAKNAGAPVQAGDTLMLMTGLHGVVLLDAFINTETISIMAANGETPIVDHIRFRSCKNWLIKGVSISSESSGYYTEQHLIWVNSHGWVGPSSHIDILDCTIYSGLDSWNWTLQQWLDRSTNGIYADGDHINIENNLVTNINMGITAIGDSCNVISNQVINFSGDGMRALGSHLLMEGNLVKNCFNVDDNHDDGIQSFNLGTYDVSNVTIRNNVIINYDDINQPFRGPLQGIGCFDGPYNNWTIENNLISVDHWHGISIYGGYDCVINNNTVIDPTPDITPGSSWIRINDQKDGTPSERCVVKNNISNKLIVDAEESNNLLLTEYSDYDEHFVDYSANDFHLISSSTAIDAGDVLYTPEIDLDGVSRPQGVAVDLGAYEYEFPSATNTIGKEELLIYPNPCRDYIILEHDLNAEKLIFTDLIGQQILVPITKEGLIESRLDVSGLQAGVYFLQLGDSVVQFVKL